MLRPLSLSQSPKKPTMEEYLLSLLSQGRAIQISYNEIEKQYPYWKKYRTGKGLSAQSACRQFRRERFRGFRFINLETLQEQPYAIWRISLRELQK
jgi:hypothetical protein